MFWRRRKKKRINAVLLSISSTAIKIEQIDVVLPFE